MRRFNIFKKMGVSVFLILGSIFLVNMNVFASEEYKEVADVESFKEAIANGENVKLNASFELSETIKMSNQNITLDLNGYTITGKDNKTSGNFNLLEVLKGELTIIDSKGNGAITLTATTNRNWGGMSTIIENRAGIVNIKNGEIKHLGGSDMAFAINVNANSLGDTTLNISGGTLYSTYTAVRLFMSTSGTSYLNITGGNIDGQTSAIWAQAPESKVGQTGSISISNGNIGTINTARGEKSTVSTEVSGGSITNIKSEAGELQISGGHVSGTLTILDTNNEVVSNDEIITGGTFDSDPTNYLASSVAVSSTITKENDTIYAIGEASIQNMVSTLEKGSTVLISGNMNLTNVQNGVTIKTTENSNVTANGIIVPKEGIVIEDKSNASTDDLTEEKLCPNDNAINIQSCINDGQTEEACIQKLCPNTETVENPKTGNYLSLFGILIVAIITSFIFMATREKNYFVKIK